MQNQNKNIEELLITLRERLKGPIDFDIKREIVKTLVKEIVVDTTFNGDDGSGKRADIKAKYRFPQIVVRTHARRSRWA